jgi:hypothetical protein
LLLQTSAQVFTCAPETHSVFGSQLTLRHIVIEHLGSFTSARMVTAAAAAISTITATGISLFILSSFGSRRFHQDVDAIQQSEV